MSFSIIQQQFPKYANHFAKASVKECIHSLAEEKKGEALVSFFKEAVESKKWKENNQLRSVLKEAAKIGPKENSLSKSNKKTLEKTGKIFKEKSTKHKLYLTKTAFESLPGELRALSNTNQEQMKTVKEHLRLALKDDFSRTLQTVKKHAQSESSLLGVTQTFKELVTAESSTGIKAEDIATLQRITNCFEALSASNQDAKKFTRQELFPIAILTQHEIPKIKKIKDKLLGSDKDKIKKKELHIPYDLYVNAKKKKIYVLTKKKLGEGGFKKVVAAVGFTFQNSHFVSPRLVAYAETTPGACNNEALKHEVNIAKQVKDVTGVLEPRVATVKKTPKGKQMVMITDICEGDLNYTMQNGNLSKKERVQIIKDAVTAVKGFHNKGFAHNDLKPWNFLIKNRRAKLIDFGVSYTLNSGNPSRFGCYGTIVYNSPEVLTNSEHQTPREADVFALGLTLWDLISMQRPMWYTWENTIDSFARNFRNQLPVLPDSRLKNALYERIERICNERIQQLEIAPNQTAEDRALVACAKTVQKMLRPTWQRITLDGAEQELQTVVA